MSVISSILYIPPDADEKLESEVIGDFNYDFLIKHPAFIITVEDSN
jgi:hypothetical protein